MYLCGMDYKYFSPHCCKCNGFGCTTAIRWGNACHGTHSDSLYSGSEHSQFNSPRLVKREAGFPNPRRSLIGSNQLWCVNDSPYYREYLHPLLYVGAMTHPCLISRAVEIKARIIDYISLLYVDVITWMWLLFHALNQCKRPGSFKGLIGDELGHRWFR